MPTVDKDPSERYVETTDKADNPITVFSTTGQSRTAREFSKALSAYNSDGKSPSGFIVLPRDSVPESIRKGFETVNQPIQEKVPQIGGMVGSIAGISPLLAALGIKNPVSKGKAAGEATGRFVASQVNTPGKAGVAVGTAAVSPLLTASKLLSLATAAKAGAAGAAGAVGYNAGSLSTGEDFEPGKTATEFATAALGGGLQAVVSNWLTRYAKGDMAEKVAKEMIDATKARFPALANNPDMLDISGKSVQQIESMTAQMSKALRGSTEIATSTILKDINNVLPRALNKGQQDELRGSVRRLVQAQNKRLDSIGDEKAFIQGKAFVNEAADDLRNIIINIAPKGKNIDPSMLKVEGVLNGVNKELKSVEEGALVLHHLRQSSAHEGWNPNNFAQTIKGTYQDEPGSLLNQIGKILGQGRPLSKLPKPGEAAPYDEIGKKGWSMIKQFIPFGDKFPPVNYKGPQVPWQAPTQDLSRPIQSLQNFGASESGQAAMRSITEKKEK